MYKVTTFLIMLALVFIATLVLEYVLAGIQNPWPGRVLPILNTYLRRTGDKLWCEDSTDYALPVAPGDRLSLVARTKKSGLLCKKNGVTGWYYGRTAGNNTPE